MSFLENKSTETTKIKIIKVKKTQPIIIVVEKLKTVKILKAMPIKLPNIKITNKNSEILVLLYLELLKEKKEPKLKKNIIRALTIIPIENVYALCILELVEN